MDNPHVIKQGQSVLHGHTISLSAQGPVTDYVIGQSPDEQVTAPANPLSASTSRASHNEQALAKQWLCVALESNRGIFQFVSRSAFRHGEYKGEVPLLKQVKTMLEASGGQPVELDQKHKLISVHTQRNLFSDKKEGYSTSTLTIENDKGERQSIILTEAALKFDDSLSADKIALANLILDKHHEAGQSEHEPVYLSYAGVGRNATLMVYRELSQRIRDGVVKADNLNEHVLEVITKGREIRGEHFVPSEKQLSELHKALVSVCQEEAANRAVVQQLTQSIVDRVVVRQTVSSVFQHVLARIADEEALSNNRPAADEDIYTPTFEAVPRDIRRSAEQASGLQIISDLAAESGSLTALTPLTPLTPQSSLSPAHQPVNLAITHEEIGTDWLSDASDSVGNSRQNSLANTPVHSRRPSTDGEFQPPSLESILNDRRYQTASPNSREVVLGVVAEFERRYFSRTGTLNIHSK